MVFNAVMLGICCLLVFMVSWYLSSCFKHREYDGKKFVCKHCFHRDGCAEKKEEG